MGLVVQATKDPALAPAPPGSPGGADSAAVPDVFQALLTELLGTQATQPPATAPVLDPPAGAPAVDEEGAVASDPLEDSKKNALLAALAQLLPALRQEPTSAPAATAMPATGGAPGAAPPIAAPLSVELSTRPTEGADGPIPVASSTASSSEAAANTASAEGAQVSTPATPADPSQAATVATSLAPPPIAFEAILEAKAGNLARPAHGGDDSDGNVTGSPPGDAPPGLQKPDLSVVRSVGNANEQGTTGNDTAPNPGAGKPPPRASVEGVANASAQSVLHRSGDATTASVDQGQAAAPAPPQLPEAVRQVAQAVVDQVQRGSGEARLHLQPEHLGDVVVRIHADGDRVRIEIRADRPEAVQVMRDHTADLSSMLGNQGLNLADVWVGLGGQQAGNPQDGQQPATANRPGSNNFAALMGPGDPAATDLHNRVRAAYNPDGSHLYRV